MTCEITRMRAVETVSPERTDGSMSIQRTALKETQSIAMESTLPETDCANAAGKAAASARWVANPYFEMFW